MELKLAIIISTFSELASPAALVLSPSTVYSMMAPMAAGTVV